MGKIYFLLFTVFCISCTSQVKKGNHDQAGDPVGIVPLSGEFLSCDSLIWNPGIEVAYHDYIILRSSGEYLYDVFKISDDRLVKEGSFLKRGSGPFEMAHSDMFKEDRHNKLYVSDYNGGIEKIYAIPLDDIYNLYDTSQWKVIHFPAYSKHLFFPSIAMLNDSIWVLPGGEINAHNIISSVDIENGEIHALDFDFPDARFKTPGQRNITEQMVYSDATLLKHPSLDKLLYSCSSGRYAEILSVYNGDIEKRIPLFKEYPRYESKDGVNKHFKDECLRGMITRVTENKIFCLLVPLTKKDARTDVLYKGYPNYYCDELFVFDWKGTLLHRFILDMPVCSFVTNEQGNVIYATTVDSEGEYVIRKYSIPVSLEDNREC